jgi:NADH dehydrogenase FAD-containing subunit
VDQPASRGCEILIDQDIAYRLPPHLFFSYSAQTIPNHTPPPQMALKRVSVVVIGGSSAGLGVSHGLLRQVPNVRVTLVNPSNEYYFNLASPRIIAKPNSLSTSKYLYSITDAFKKYPHTSFNFIKGMVTRIDMENQNVTISKDTPSPSTSSTSSVPFDYLVIASGSTTPASIGQSGLKFPFKTSGFEDISTAIKEAQEAIKPARSVIVGGGGPLGVEVAGELAEVSDMKKDVTLISATDLLLPGVKESVRKTAESLLTGKGVTVIKSTIIEQVTQDVTSQKWTVRLSNGETMTADVYISATGVLPNNQFIPPSLLNERGWVNVDEFFQVKEGGTSKSTIYAIGDITSHPYRLLSRIPKQVSTVLANMKTSITQQGTLVSYSAEAQRKMMVVPVGDSTGTGQFGNWTLWGLLVWYFKGKDFLTYKAPGYLMGKAA